MMITKSSSPYYAKREAGGKGYNLFLLSNAGFVVPSWFVIPAERFDRFKIETSLSLKIEDELQRLAGSNHHPSEFEKSSLAITDLILCSNHKLNDELLSDYQNLGKDILVAVRSSALDEDSGQHSFAGQLSSFLYVHSLEDVCKYVLQCWASAFSARCLSYRWQNKLEISSKVKVAVVVQSMIDPDRSGVLFTCNPLTKDSKVLVINSVYGVGEGLVSGALEPDSYEVQKLSGAVLSRNIVEKQSAFRRRESGEVQAVALPVEQHFVSSLSDGEIEEIRQLSQKLESFYGFPQDAEWAVQGKTLYLLQSRPITTDIFAFAGKLNVWDNSNIVESYGGLTLPLTFTFARFVYHQVYVQMCEILMVPLSEIKRMDHFLKNMLGMIHGRVYYNILNWYKLTSILPGFKYNRGFMETMMGTTHALSDEISERIAVSESHRSLKAKTVRFFAGCKFLYFHFTTKSMISNFLSYFKKVYDEFRHLPYANMHPSEVMAAFEQLELKLLSEWKAPIINDYLCMVHFGIFKSLAQKWCAGLGDTIQNDLLCGEGGLESAEPTRELIRLAGEVSINSKLKELFLCHTPNNLHEVIRKSEFVDFSKKIDRYIDLYGHRCMSEMKLEQPDLHQDPSFLFVCLKNYIRGEAPDLGVMEAREHAIRSRAEGLVNSSLSGWKKIVFSWSLKNARLAVKNRENTRFCRTRIYGVVRSMFFSIGEFFCRLGSLDTPSDVFYLELQELRATIDGYLTVEDLKSLVNLRKISYANYAKLDPPSRIVTRGPVYWGNQLKEEIEETTVSSEDLLPGQLLGTGCCPGEVEGIVKVVLEPTDNMELSKEILVTLRTDPGWIPLYPSLSGLLVERGGLLSHSAIVAREMGLPTIVGIKGLTSQLKNGMRIRMNGQTGLIQILEESASSDVL